MTGSSTTWRRAAGDQATRALTAAGALIGVGILAVIVAIVLIRGAGAISWTFLTQESRSFGAEGGILGQLIGTLLLIAGTLLVSLPLGIGTAIALTEFGGGQEGGPTIWTIRTALEVLNGVPSIVYGLFGYAALVVFLGLGRSLLVGVVILSVMILPITVRTAEEALRRVPSEQREIARTLGATEWRALWEVVLPQAAAGIISGLMLGLGRAMGETAPLLFTAVVFSGVVAPDSPFSPVSSLPTHLMILAQNAADPLALRNAWGTALVLLGLAVLFNAAATILRSRSRKGGPG